MKLLILGSALCGMLIFGAPGVSVHDSHGVAHASHVDHATHQADAQDRCRYEEERSLELSAGSGDQLVLTVGSGSLEVIGRSGLSEVRAVGRVCSSHEEWLEELDIVGERRGSEVVVEATYPDRDNWRDLFRGNNYARIDMVVEVPAGMAAEIDDSSGGITIRDLGSLYIDDSSGEIEIENCSGSIEIDDSSGEIWVTGVRGDLIVDDSSGEIELFDIEGSVTITDGSGEIQVEDVTQDVLVRSDGSGSIYVDGVGGDFIVRRDGSGSIRYRNVEGEVDIPRRRR